MKLSDIIQETGLTIQTQPVEDYEIHSGYACDLLSEVMGRAKPGSIWITVQSHSNIVAVASITGIRAIVLVNARSYSEDTIAKAKEEGIALLQSDIDTFTLSGKIYAMLQG